MPPETRSLWEIYDSEVEPWRRGRFVLVLVAIFSAILQGVVFAAGIMMGDIQGLLVFSSICVVFWLPFYFIWIGVHWIRLLVGAVAGLSGFCSLIWGLRDSNGFLVLFGAINLLIGAYFCLSSSVYFFAKRQHENRSWLHSLIVAAVFILLLATFFLGSIGVFAYRTRLQADAIQFVAEAAEHIYTNEDRDWLLTHSTENALVELKGQNLDVFFALMNRRPGPVLQISAASGPVHLVYHFPSRFTFIGHLSADGKSAYGPFRLHFLIFNSGQAWQIERTWWEQLYTESPPSF
jgi:hypothetical protein